jgi:hypothetical protein
VFAVIVDSDVGFLGPGKGEVDCIVGGRVEDVGAGFEVGFRAASRVFEAETFGRGGEVDAQAGTEIVEEAAEIKAFTTTGEGSAAGWGAGRGSVVRSVMVSETTSSMRAAATAETTAMRTVAFGSFMSWTSGMAKRSVGSEGEVSAEHEWRGPEGWASATPWPVVVVGAATTVAASLAAVAVPFARFFVLLVFVVAVEGFSETASAAEGHAFAVRPDGCRVDLGGIFVADFGLFAFGLLAGAGVGVGGSSRCCSLGLLGTWTRLSLLSEERMVFHSGNKVPERVGWCVQVVDWRHLGLIVILSIADDVKGNDDLLIFLDGRIDGLREGL